jgi:hypothetical protein
VLEPEPVRRKESLRRQSNRYRPQQPEFPE